MRTGRDITPISGANSSAATSRNNSCIPGSIMRLRPFLHHAIIVLARHLSQVLFRPSDLLMESSSQRLADRSIHSETERRISFIISSLIRASSSDFLIFIFYPLRSLSPLRTLRFRRHRHSACLKSPLDFFIPLTTLSFSFFFRFREFSSLPSSCLQQNRIYQA